MTLVYHDFISMGCNEWPGSVCKSTEETASTRRHMSGTRPELRCVTKAGLRFHHSRLLSDLFSPVGTPRVLKAERCRLCPGPQGCDSTVGTRVPLCLQDMSMQLASPGSQGTAGVCALSVSIQHFCPEMGTTESCCFSLQSTQSGRGHQQEMTGLRVQNDSSAERNMNYKVLHVFIKIDGISMRSMLIATQTGNENIHMLRRYNRVRKPTFSGPPVCQR